MKQEHHPYEQEERADPPDLLQIIQSSAVPPKILGKMLGEEIQERLGALRPALIPWDLTKEKTAFFLCHQEDLTKIMVFVSGSTETDDREKALSPAVRRYLAELRQDLREIIESGALAAGMGSYFAIENRPAPSPPIRPQDWHPHTIAFIEQLRPQLEGLIKARHVDRWLQTPIDVLGGFSPIEVIQYGGGSRILVLMKEMEFQGVT